MDSRIPPYEQVSSQIAGMAASGVLPVGFRLPGIRQLASDLGLAPGTIARAYRELESEGVVSTRAGRGTTIAAAASSQAEQERRQGLLAAAEHYATEAVRLGFSREQALAVLDTQLSARYQQVG